MYGQEDGVIHVVEYTPDEQHIGTYLGNNSLYRKSWLMGNIAGSGSVALPLKKIIEISGSIRFTDDGATYPLFYDNGSIFFRAYHDGSNLVWESNVGIWQGHVSAATLIRQKRSGWHINSVI
jgi:hypothetical protein